MQLTLSQNSGSQCYGNLIGKQSENFIGCNLKNKVDISDP